MDVIRQDFDRLAAFEGSGWSHNKQFYPYLLSRAPSAPSYSLEIGCGAGSFTRLLAQRSGQVLPWTCLRR